MIRNISYSKLGFVHQNCSTARYDGMCRAAFAGSDDKAVVDGDFAMHESEVQEILKALRHANINIVSIHQHMIGENPRIIFLHYWGIGNTEHLAKALRTALNAT